MCRRHNGRYTSQSPPGYTNTAAPDSSASLALSGLAATVPNLRSQPNIG